MKHLIPVLLIIMLPVISLGQQWKTFTDTAGNFTASYPSNWINKIKAGNRVFFTSPSDGKDDAFYENINIAVSYNKDYANNPKVSDLMPDVTQQLSGSFTEFKKESLRYFKWNKMDAAELVYTGYGQNDNTLKVRCTQWFCFFGSKLYLVTFVSDAATGKHNTIARKIMSGIVFH